MSDVDKATILDLMQNFSLPWAPLKTNSFLHHLTNQSYQYFQRSFSSCLLDLKKPSKHSGSFLVLGVAKQ